MSFRSILFEAIDDSLALITVNRPDKLNALTHQVVAELDEAFRRVESDRGVRGLIVTGSGEKAFVAGADIGEMAALTPAEAEAFSLKGQRVLRRLETMGKPSVAAINGFALGGGLELAMACTLRVASENAEMGLPEAKLGFLAGYGGTQRLPRLVGRGRAAEMILTGETATALEAHRIGLVNHVVPQAELLAFSKMLIGKILSNAPLAVGLNMKAIDTGLSCGLEEGLRYEAAAFGLAVATQDCREGLLAFTQKRKPVFQGR